MKQIKTLLIASILILGASQTINAQAKKAAVNQTTKTEVDINQPAKTAHVDVSEIMSKMPAMLDAQKQLEKLSTT